VPEAVGVDELHVVTPLACRAARRRRTQRLTATRRSALDSLAEVASAQAPGPWMRSLQGSCPGAPEGLLVGPHTSAGREVKTRAGD
jgi:hypothetical protein